jgi:Terminase large subunit, T4likevirus-type, N-terminal
MSSDELARDLRLALDPGQLLQALGITPDDWQDTMVRKRPQRGQMLCCRQAGKSTAAAVAALHEALYAPGALILMIAPTQRQSAELLRKARFLLNARPNPVKIVSESTTVLELGNGSRILSLPAAEDTVRGYSAATLIIIDEAAWVSDDLYFALRPMLAVSNGRLLALSTPNGQRGWFYQAWDRDDDSWFKVKITAEQCPRISPTFLEEERRTMTAAVYASEYLCEFGDTLDSVFAYDDVIAALDPDLTPLFEKGWT